MANPTRISYRIPTSNTDGSPLAQADIKQIDIGVGSTSGQYTMIAPDVTFTPGTDGFSTEPLSVFGMLAPGTYFAAARTVSKANIMSAWSNEAQFTIEPPIPNAPTGFTIA